MSDSEPKPDIPPQRLCSEIQLFDLCDAETCHKKIGRYCTDPVLLDRFEKITESEFRPQERNISEEIDDADEDDEFEMDDFEGGEDDGWEDEE